MPSLTPMESELRDACVLALHYLTRRRVGKTEYVDLVESLRNVVRKTNYRESGCSTGKHSSYCACPAGVSR
jgi:hypothetical protein